MFDSRNFVNNVTFDIIFLKGGLSSFLDVKKRGSQASKGRKWSARNFVTKVTQNIIFLKRLCTYHFAMTKTEVLKHEKRKIMFKVWLWEFCYQGNTKLYIPKKGCVQTLFNDKHMNRSSKKKGTKCLMFCVTNSVTKGTQDIIFIKKLDYNITQDIIFLKKLGSSLFNNKNIG